MKIFILLAGILFLSFCSKAQNLPSCDSLIINCCTFDTLGTNTLTIYASNYSSYLFDYPGFVLFDTLMDTIAKETVAYFGIGSGPQPHTMDIIAPLTLPFSGSLNLYTLFYSSFACSFPFTIPDTTLGIKETDHNSEVGIFPNPSPDKVTITVDDIKESKIWSLVIVDVLGKELKRQQFDRSPLQLTLDKINPGIYFLKISDDKNQLRFSGKLVVQ